MAWTRPNNITGTTIVKDADELIEANMADLQDYINGEGNYTSGGLDEQAIINALESADVRVDVPSGLTVTVGAGGDYASLSLAIQYLQENYHPNGNIATISMLSGFVVSEALSYSYVDLSWIHITGVDATTTIDGSAFAQSSAFITGNNASLPTIGQLFTYSNVTMNVDLNKDCFRVHNNSFIRIEPNCGVTNCTGTALEVYYGSRAYANNSIFDDNYFAIRVQYGSNFVGWNIEANRAVYSSLYVGNGSSADADNINANNCGGIQAIVFFGGSHGHVRYCSATSCQYGSGITAQGSIVDCSYSSASSLDAGSFGFHVTNGGILSAFNSSGTLSQTANTYSSEGVIHT